MDEPSSGRIYDGALGRFVQADPIIQDPLRVQSLNRYSYVWNNPLNATDPSGFETCRTTISGDEKCTKEAKDDKPPEEVTVTGTKKDKERPTGTVITFVNANISGQSFSNYVFRGQGFQVAVDGDIVDKYTGGNIKNLTKEKLTKILMEGAASENSLAIATDAALETMGDVGGFENLEGNPFLGAVAIATEQATMGIVFGNTSILSLRTTPQIEAHKAAAMEGKAGKLLQAVMTVGMVRGGFLKASMQKHHLIPNAVHKKFSKLFDPKYYQDHAKNLLSLKVPFHGNHPAYNNYVEGKLNNMLQNGPLTLDRLKSLQNDLRSELTQLQRHGMVDRLNQYYKDLGF